MALDRGLIDLIEFGCELKEATWSEASDRWNLVTSKGELAARHLILGTGPLSEPSIPDLPGLSRFKGRVFHSASWDHHYDLRGKRVAVVGTGASAIQFIPEIQPEVERLHLFQRTAPWVMARRDRRLSGFERRLFRRLPFLQQGVRAAVYWGRELLAIPLLKVALAPLTIRVATAHLHRQVADPNLRRTLTPDYAPGCKRILLSNNYYPALSQPNVEVVASGAAELRENSIVTPDGVEREVDAVIFGTGFRVTDLPIGERIRGRNGASLASVAAGSPTAHRGTCVAGFPNLFILLGPNTGLGHTSVVLMAEAQARYIRRAIQAGQRAGRPIEVSPEAQREWNRQIQRRLEGTVWTAGGCKSWYQDSNGCNTTLWPGFSFQFVRAMARFDPESYVGLTDVRRQQPLAGKRVLVTGAAGAFGSSVSLELRRLGAEVAGLDRQPGPGIIEADLRDPESVTRGVRQAVLRLGGLDILINNAGVGTVSGAGEMPSEAEREMLDVNLFGAWRVTAAALPELLQSRGRVINVASGLAVAAFPLLGGYMASKRGLAAWSDALRLEYGPRLSGVSTIYPGYVETPIHRPAAAEGYSMEGLIPPEPLAATVGAIVGACSGRARRDVVTTRRLRLALFLTRLLPGPADRVVAALAYRAARGGRLAAGPLGDQLRLSALAGRTKPQMVRQAP